MISMAPLILTARSIIDKVTDIVNRNEITITFNIETILHAVTMMNGSSVIISFYIETILYAVTMTNGPSIIISFHIESI